DPIRRGHRREDDRGRGADAQRRRPGRALLAALLARARRRSRGGAPDHHPGPPGRYGRVLARHDVRAAAGAARDRRRDRAAGLGAMRWSVRSEESIDLTEAERILNEDHYGLTKVKERILEFVAVRKLMSERRAAEAAAGQDARPGRGLRSPILLLVGPPGVGK